MADYDSEKTAFNSAIEMLRMMCRALEACSHGRYYSDPHLWYKGILDFRSQIYSYFSQDEKDKINAFLPAISAEFKKATKRDGNISFTPKLYSMLDSVELYLRELQEKHGLGIPKSDDPNFAVLRGH